MELLLLRVPFPRRLLINQIGSFRATASIDAGLGELLTLRPGHQQFGLPTPEHEQGPPIPRIPARPLAGRGRRRLIYPHSLTFPP